jgi:hypothetical protein
MSKIEELEELLRSDVLVEIKDEIEALEQTISKKKSKALEYELNFLLEVRKFYEEALSLIEKNALSEEEATNILLDLEDMREDDEEI